MKRLLLSRDADLLKKKYEVSLEKADEAGWQDSLPRQRKRAGEEYEKILSEGRCRCCQKAGRGKERMIDLEREKALNDLQCFCYRSGNDCNCKTFV